MKSLVFGFVLLATIMHAQQTTLANIQPPAMPGVTLRSPGQGLLSSYQFQPGFQMTDLAGQSQKVNYSERWNYKVRIPFVLAPRLTVLGGIQYQKEQYYFNTSQQTDLLFSELNGTELKSTRFSLYAVQSLNTKFYVGLQLDAAYSGNYDNVDGHLAPFAAYRATAALGYKPNPQTEYGLGLFYSNGIRRTSIVPVAFFNHTFNDKWGLEMTLPVKVKARYNFSPKSLLLFGAEFDRQNYAINTSDEGAYFFHFRRSAVSFGTAYMHNIKGWLWFQAKAGYAINLSNRVDNVQTGFNSNLTQTNTPFLSVGLFLSPTRKRK